MSVEPVTALDLSNLHALACHFEAADSAREQARFDRNITETAAKALRRAVRAMQAAGWGAEPQGAARPATEACRPFMSALADECDGNARAGPDNAVKVKRCGECGTWFVVGADGDRHYLENHPATVAAAREAGARTDSPRGFYKW
jgi:hypothetical protein